MSRIDEAMRRVSQAPHTGRGHTRGTDGSGSLRLADDVTLNEYPLEGRAGARVEMTIASEPRVAAEPRICAHATCASGLKSFAICADERDVLGFSIS